MLSLSPSILLLLSFIYNCLLLLLYFIGITQSFLEQEGTSFNDAWEGFQSWVRQVVVANSGYNNSQSHNRKNHSAVSNKEDGDSSSTGERIIITNSDTSNSSTESHQTCGTGTYRGVVFIAHNGLNFDFALLSNMYKKQLLLMNQQQHSRIRRMKLTGFNSIMRYH